MKCAIYIRVSTTEQAEKGTSLKTQEEALKKYCQENNYQIYNIYKDDGYSGGTLDRPGIQRLLEDIKEGKFQAVIVYKTDRLSRSIRNIVNLVLGDFEKYGIIFKSITEPYDTSMPAGRMFFVQLSSFAEFERETIKERSKEGKLRRTLEGKYMLSVPPFGYRKDKNKRLIIDREEKKVYLQIVRWCLDGVGSNTIARRLNERNIPTKKAKLYNKPYRWKQGTVLDFLKHPRYKGEFIYKGHKVKIPALITEGRWEQVQRQLESNYNNALRHTRRFYLLRNLLYCKKCGRRLFGLIKPKKGMRLYCCLSKRPDPEPRFCGLKNVNIDKTNIIVWNKIKEIVKNSQKLKEAIEEQKGSHYVKGYISEIEVKNINQIIQSKEREIDRILELYSRSKALSIAELDRKVDGIKKQKDNLVQEREKISEEINRARQAKETLKHLENYMAKISKRIDNFTNEEKYEFIHLIVSKIIVDYDRDLRYHSIEIEGAIPIFREEDRIPKYTPLLQQDNRYFPNRGRENPPSRRGEPLSPWGFILR